MQIPLLSSALSTLIFHVFVCEALKSKTIHCVNILDLGDEQSLCTQKSKYQIELKVEEEEEEEEEKNPIKGRRECHFCIIFCAAISWNENECSASLLCCLSCISLSLLAFI